MLLDYLMAKRHISIIDKLIKRDQQFYQILITKMGLTNIHFAPIISTKSYLN